MFLLFCSLLSALLFVLCLSLFQLFSFVSLHGLHPFRSSLILFNEFVFVFLFFLIRPFHFSLHPFSIFSTFASLSTSSSSPCSFVLREGVFFPSCSPFSWSLFPFSLHLFFLLFLSPVFLADPLTLAEVHLDSKNKRARATTSSRRCRTSMIYYSTDYRSGKVE